MSSTPCTSTVQEQVGAQGSNIVEVGNVQAKNITSRIRNRQGQSHGSGFNLSSLSPNASNKAAAGDDKDLMDKLGVFLNGNVGFGDRKTTANTLGYDLDKQDATVGVDYKLTDSVLVGTAFGYGHAKNSFINGLGDLNSDSYIGSIYSSYYTDSGLFVDGIFSGTSIDYTTHSRNINNVIADTQTWGSNKGTEFDVSMTTGYNYSKGGLTLTPQVRVEHITAHISGLTQVGNGGLLAHVNDQDIESLKTGTGGQLSYALSFPWGVLVPTARAEWIHEFQNDRRAIYSRIYNVPTPLTVTLTDRPDRDYVNLSTGFSAQFAHGISAFANYETIQGLNYLRLHTFTGGMRLEF